MMKFLEKNKKWFFLLSIFFFVLSLGAVLLDAVGIIFNMQDYYMLRIPIQRYLVQYVSPVSGIILSLLYLVGTIITAGIACWKREKSRVPLAITGVLLLLTMVCPFLLNIISSVLLRYGSVSYLLTVFFESGPLVVLLALYFILFSFVKFKGPAVPVLGIVLIILCPLLSGITYTFYTVHALNNLIQYSELWHFGVVLRNVSHLLGVIFTSIGWLLLMPLVLYIPKKSEKEKLEINKEDIPKVVE